MRRPGPAEITYQGRLFNFDNSHIFFVLLRVPGYRVCIRVPVCISQKKSKTYYFFNAYLADDGLRTRDIIIYNILSRVNKR